MKSEDDQTRFQDYYTLLGIDPGAEAERVRTAYREKMKVWHPDRNAHRLAEAEEMAKIFNAAYSVLKDPEQRKQYDRILRYAKSKGAQAGLEESAFFHKLRKASPALGKMVDSARELYLLFSDAVHGHYRLHPASLMVVAGGLLYFVVPTDFIPDVLPVVGFVDDLAVLTTVVNALQSELATYRKWKRSAGAA